MSIRCADSRDWHQPDGWGDPNFTEGTPRNQNNPSGALPDAPVSGRWFQAQFEELLANASPPV